MKKLIGGSMGCCGEWAISLIIFWQVLLIGIGAEAIERQPQVGLATVRLSESEVAEVDAMVLQPPPDWSGDFAGMRERQMIRLLVPYSKTFFYLDQGRQKGIDYEFGKQLEKWLDTHHPLAGSRRGWQVLFIPVRRDQLLPSLLAGKGDLAAGGLTVTAERLQQVDFVAPIAKGVKEVVVGRVGEKGPRSIDDLAGKEITVRRSSSYYEHLVDLNDRFKKRGLKPIRIVEADEWLESEDILEMVNAGLVKMTVVDQYLANIWWPLYKSLLIHGDIAINRDGHLAWASRKNSPQLHAVLEKFMSQHRVGTTFGNIQVARYVKDSQRVLNPTSSGEMRKFQDLIRHFRTYGGTYEFDYLMLMAQGYQESRLNQKARSVRGAVGVMQLLPSTAADPAVGIPHIDKSAERNIEAGAKYMRLLADNYLDDSQISPVDRTLMTFAAYNAGPGNLQKFRRLAEKSGYDANVWFQNVEYAAARIVGQETVRYVSNIYKYYLAYTAVEKHRQAKKDIVPR